MFKNIKFTECGMNTIHNLPTGSHFQKKKNKLIFGIKK